MHRKNVDHFRSNWDGESFRIPTASQPHPSTNKSANKFDHFPWEENHQHLQRWQKGETGIPIVDAGMRELWKTGYMHNRVRMIVGSFLVKNLLLDWKLGEAWFRDCLVDADHANNCASWQWVAGVEPMPLRIFEFSILFLKARNLIQTVTTPKNMFQN